MTRHHSSSVSVSNPITVNVAARSTLIVRFRRSRPRRHARAISIVTEADKKPLVVVGSVNADMMLQVDRFPKPGETLSAKSMNTSAGGKVHRAFN